MYPLKTLYIKQQKVMDVLSHQSIVPNHKQRLKGDRTAKGRSALQAGRVHCSVRPHFTY